ncbi:ComEC/Rec2 family competence protein [Parasphingorhabdus sp.]|uniref:ComEC/Rec2 family competence protein n=1 Tax=Parasphingorhabdus sp. TaxID=2709688 RepID=UPI003D2CCA16
MKNPTKSLGAVFSQVSKTHTNARFHWKNLLSATIFVGLSASSSLAAAKDSELVITNIRVGQGDATLIQGPIIDGKRVNVLFDAGNISGLDGGNILNAVLRKNGVRSLDYFVVSHDDADHLGGAVFGGTKSNPKLHGRSFILGPNNVAGCPGDDDKDGITDWITKEYIPDPEEIGPCDDVAVKNFVDYGEKNMRETLSIKKYNAMANTIGKRHTIADQKAVNSFQIDLGNNAKMVAYAGNGYVRNGKGKRDKAATSPNERSLAFLVTYGDFDFLIAGDLIGKQGLSCNKKTGKWTTSNSSSTDAKMETALGKALAKSKRRIDVLHVNHHGADNGSSSEFLNLIKPNIAIISAGNGNSHEHPKLETLERLYAASVYQIIQTSWGTTEKMIPGKIRYRQAIYQNDIVIKSTGIGYSVGTSRYYDSDKNYVPKNLKESEIPVSPCDA